MTDASAAHRQAGEDGQDFETRMRAGMHAAFPMPAPPRGALAEFRSLVQSQTDADALRRAALDGATRVAGFGHAAWIDRDGTKFHLRGLSGMEGVDDGSPFAAHIRHALSEHLLAGLLNSTHPFRLPARRGGYHYPYQQAFWAPFAPDARRGGLLFTRSLPFAQLDLARLARVADIAGRALVRMERRDALRPCTSLPLPPSFRDRPRRESGPSASP